MMWTLSSSAAAFTISPKSEKQMVSIVKIVKYLLGFINTQTDDLFLTILMMALIFLVHHMHS